MLLIPEVLDMDLQHLRFRVLYSAQMFITVIRNRYPMERPELNINWELKILFCQWRFRVAYLADLAISSTITYVKIKMWKTPLFNHPFFSIGNSYGLMQFVSPDICQSAGWLFPAATSVNCEKLSDPENDYLEVFLCSQQRRKSDRPRLSTRWRTNTQPPLSESHLPYYTNGMVISMIGEVKWESLPSWSRRDFATSIFEFYEEPFVVLKYTQQTRYSFRSTWGPVIPLVNENIPLWVLAWPRT